MLQSSVAWLDHDPEAQRRMQRILRLFDERDTRNELGLGATRDAFSDRLFPGTSTIQTRLRYFLFVPWTYQRIEQDGIPPGEGRKLAREKNPGVGDAWVLPSPTDPSKPCSRHLVRDWWLRMEKAAELEPVRQLGWHGLRRKFATELKDAPLKDLCHLGGWKSPHTVLQCYLKPDEDTMRQVLENRRAVGQPTVR